MRTKVIAITICQDCPKQDCAERTPCGTIPDTCPLPDKPIICTECGSVIPEWEAQTAKELRICTSCRINKLTRQIKQDIALIKAMCGGADE